MQYTHIQGLTLSRLTLGTVQLGMPYGIGNQTGQPSLEEAFALLDAAREGGVTVLDTAAQYGTSEAVIGQYLKAHPSYQPVLCSKFKLDGKQPASELRTSLAGSLARLGLRKIPVYLLHKASQMTDYGPVITQTLEHLRDEGKIDVAGVSVYTAQEVETYLKCDLYGAIQLPMGVLDTRLIRSGLLEELRKRDIAVFVRSVYTQGLILMESLPEKYAIAQESVREVRAIARMEEMSVPQLAVSFVRDLPGVSSLVLGCETIDQVRENQKLMKGPALSPAAREAILQLNPPIDAIMRTIQGG